MSRIYFIEAWYRRYAVVVDIHTELVNIHTLNFHIEKLVKPEKLVQVTYGG